MTKFIVWADGSKDKSRSIEAADMSEAIEAACDFFDAEANTINVIEAGNVGAAQYYGVSDAE